MNLRSTLSVWYDIVVAVHSILSWYQGRELDHSPGQRCCALGQLHQRLPSNQRRISKIEADWDASSKRRSEPSQSASVFTLEVMVALFSPSLPPSFHPSILHPFILLTKS